MGTAKRERKKANRQAKLEALQRQQARRKTIRRAVTIGVLLVVFVVGAWLLSQLVSGGGDEPAATTTTTTATSDTTAAAGFAYGTTPCPAADGSAPQQREFADSFQQCIDPTKTYTALVETNKGAFTITLDAARAPGTVNNFVALARHKFYDGLTFHRVVKGFVIQGGDPEGTGAGGPGYTFADELPEAGAYQLGSVAMANSGPNTNGSQFFVVTGERGTELPPNYSLFGQVTDGFDTTVKALEAAGGEGDGPPTEPLVIERITITEQ